MEVDESLNKGKENERQTKLQSEKEAIKINIERIKGVNGDL